MGKKKVIELLFSSGEEQEPAAKKKKTPASGSTEPAPTNGAASSGANDASASSSSSKKPPLKAMKAAAAAAKKRSKNHPKAPARVKKEPKSEGSGSMGKTPEGGEVPTDTSSSSSQEDDEKDEKKKAAKRRKLATLKARAILAKEEVTPMNLEATVTEDPRKKTTITPQKGKKGTASRKVPEIKNVVSNHSKILFGTAKFGKSKIVADAIQYKPIDIVVQPAPTPLSESRVNSGDLVRLSNRTTMRVNSESSFSSAMKRLLQLRSSLKRDVLRFIKDIEQLQSSLAGVKDQIAIDAGKLDDESFWAIGQGDNAYDHPFSNAASEDLAEKNFKEMLVDQIDELPDDMMEWVLESCPEKPGARKRFINIVDNVLNRLETATTSFTEDHNAFIDKLVAVKKETLIHLLELYLNGGAVRMDGKEVHDEGMSFTEAYKARLSMEQCCQFLKLCKPTQKGRLLLKENFLIPPTTGRKITSQDANHILPRGSMLSVINTSQQASNLYARYDAVEDLIMKLELGNIKGKINVDVEAPIKQFSRYAQMKTSCRATYRLMQRKIKDIRQMDAIRAFHSTSNSENLECPRGAFYGRPDFHGGNRHLLYYFTVVGITDNAEMHSLPNLIVYGSGLDTINGEYAYEGSSNYKPKYQKITDSRCKLYFNLKENEWRFFISRTRGYDTEKPVTLYTNNTSRKLPSDGFRSLHETAPNPPPRIDAKTCPGQSLLRVFGTGSSWTELEIAADSIDQVGSVRNPKECMAMLRNINKLQEDSMVTPEFRNWFTRSPVNNDYHGHDLLLKQFDEKLTQSIILHEAPSLPFDGKCTSWYCACCNSWQDSCDKASQAKHQCGSHLQIKSAEPLKFKQFIGETFAFCIHYEMTNKRTCDITLSAHLNQVIERLMWSLYWKADEHRAKYLLHGKGEVKDEKANYVLLSSEDIPPAKQPKRLRLNLTPKQLCTLAWMIERENTDTPFLTELQLERTVFGSDLHMTLVLEREYHNVHGGILADEVGYGKTACVIALVASTLSTPVEHKAPYGFIRSNATLIIAPMNLFGQWLEEFKKFLAPEEFDRLKIVEITGAVRMKRLTVHDIMDADIVLVHTRFFLSDCYEQSLNTITKQTGKSNSGTTPTKELDEYEVKRYGQLREFTSKFVEFTKKKRPRDCKDANTPQMIFEESSEPLLEMFYYKRVVFDEFHEVMADQTPRGAYAMMQLFGRYHWGLSGTPPLESVDSVQKIANFLHLSVSASVRETQHFINEWVRSNTWDKKSVELKNIEIQVTHTKDERSLYLLQKNLLANQASGVKMEERLLQLCTYFNPDGKKEDTSAEAAVLRAQNDLKAKVERFTKLLTEKKKIYEDLTVLIDLEEELSRTIEEKQIPEEFLQPKDASAIISYFKLDVIKLHIEAFKAENTEEDIEELEEEKKKLAATETKLSDISLVQLRNRNGQPVRALHELFDAKVNMSSKSEGHRAKNKMNNLEERHNTSQREMSEAQEKLNTAETQLRFFEATLASLVTKEGQTGECSVCLEDTSPETCAVTVCGHIFHLDCIKDCVEKQLMCPFCRKEITMKEVDLVHTFAAKKPESEKEKKTIGSKMRAILDELENILTTEPSAKVILFCQWEKILETLNAVLKAERPSEHPPLRLWGTQIHRQHTLRDFIDSTESRILLLSLEYSPTGMNLVCCHHVFLVHPMYADSPERAIAYEMQAIGRVRRQGQTHPVEVRRFATKGTVEEEITLRHREQLKM